ncbi:MAG TPA: energy transducer TonB [Longimicrobiaceae bacterium]
MQQHLTPEALVALAGVSALPKPIDPAALPAAVRRHYPPALRDRGVRGFVLVEASIDEHGSVTAVEVIPSPGGPAHRAVLISHDQATGAESRRTMMGGDSDPAFGEAARAALGEVQFSPAMRDGHPVPFKLRMSLHFDP